MAVVLRLTRTGKKKQPSYRIVAADSRAPRQGRFIERLGHYNPRLDPAELVLDREKVQKWLDRGATPSQTVRRLLSKEGFLKQTAAQ